ncbi:MAG: peptidoglycan DD-metalloendopeptidase family protein [Pseudomonadota bacterium]
MPIGVTERRVARPIRDCHNTPSPATIGNDYNQWMLLSMCYRASMAVVTTLAAVSLHLGSLPAALAEFPAHTPVPGGIAVVPVTGERKPTVRIGDRRIAVVRDNGRWLAVAGIPLDTPTGPLTLDVISETARTSQAIEIGTRNYREQHLTIKEKRYVNPDAAELARYRTERQTMDDARASWRDSNTVAVFELVPVPGKRSDSFGSRRFFNGQPRNPHSGMDIAAPAGTPVRAPAAGIVAATGDFFFNGKTVMLDHGNGLVTLYCHLSEVLVTKGDRITLGETIGLVGATGRVTGAHLHWSVYLSGVAIDPSLMLSSDAAP